MNEEYSVSLDCLHFSHLCRGLVFLSAGRNCLCSRFQQMERDTWVSIAGPYRQASRLPCSKERQIRTLGNPTVPKYLGFSGRRGGQCGLAPLRGPIPRKGTDGRGASRCVRKRVPECPGGRSGQAFQNRSYFDTSEKRDDLMRLPGGSGWPRSMAIPRTAAAGDSANGASAR